MKKLFFVTLLTLFLFAVPHAAHSQDFVTNGLTAQAAACPTNPGNTFSSTSAVTLDTLNAGGATFTIGSTAFSGTVTFYGSGDGGTTWALLNVFPSNSTTPVTTATATGLWQANVAAYTKVCILATTWASGTITVTIRKATASARAGGGGGGAAPAGVTNSIQINNGAGGFTGIGCLGGTTSPLILCSQSANSNDTIDATRFTDTTPTGTFLNFLNATANTTLYSVDVLGNATGKSFQTNGPGVGYFQCSNGNGTLPTLVAGAAQISCPSGAITNYQMLLPTAAGTGALCGTNAANVVTIAFGGCAGVAATGPLYFSATTYGVLADAQVNWAPSWTSGSNVITCATCNFNTTAKPGQIIFGTNVTPLGGFAQSASVIQLPQTTIMSIDSNTQIHTVGNANANWTIGPLIWGDDDSTALANSWTAAANACGMLYLPAGRMIVQQAEFITAPTACVHATGASRSGPGVFGAGMGTSTIIVTPNFVSAGCIGAGGGACFFGDAVLNTFDGGMQVKDFNIWGGGNSAIGAGFSGKVGAMFQANSSAINFTIEGWGGNTAGFIGLETTSSPVVLYNVESDSAGQTPCVITAGSSFNQTTVHGFYCGDNTGASVLDVQANSTLLSTSSLYFPNTNVNTVQVEGAFYSTNDILGSTSQGGTPLKVNAATALAYLTNDVLTGGCTSCDALWVAVSGAKAYAVNTQFLGGSGTATAIALTAAGSLFFDQGGNTFTGGGGKYTGPGPVYGSASMTGTAQVAGNIVPSACGTSTVGTVSGAGGRGQFTITFAGAPGTSCTITVTFPAMGGTIPGFMTAPICTAVDVGGTNAFPTSIVNGAVSATSFAFTETAAAFTNTNTEIMQYNCNNP